jgi:hypothetical protein
MKSTRPPIRVVLLACALALSSPAPGELLRMTAPESLRPMLTAGGSLEISTASGRMLKKCRPYLASRIVGTDDSPYAYGEMNGTRVLLPAESYKRQQNFECPQFYPLFPFNQFALGRDDMTVFKDTWKHGKFTKNRIISWHQNGIFFARMGMVKEAADFNARKLDDSGRRFPTFWGPGYDWTPDHNWGGSGMIGLQEMLMQTIGRRIVLLPAWPAEWDCDFKLHAPGQTVLEGKVRAGKVVDLMVTPASRRADVEGL